MFNQDFYEKSFVADFMTTPPAIVNMNDPMDIVMKKFETTKAWNLPVINNGKYVGFVSKSKIFNSYRKLLQDCCDE